MSCGLILTFKAGQTLSKKNGYGGILECPGSGLGSVRSRVLRLKQTGEIGWFFRFVCVTTTHLPWQFADPFSSRKHGCVGYRFSLVSAPRPNGITEHATNARIEQPTRRRCTTTYERLDLISASLPELNNTRLVRLSPLRTVAVKQASSSYVHEKQTRCHKTVGGDKWQLFIIHAQQTIAPTRSFMRPRIILRQTQASFMATHARFWSTAHT